MSSEHVVRVVLVGFMGAGKTSVARALSSRLGWEFVDMDDEVASEAGMSVPDIFTTSGEAAFRRLERDVAARILSRERVVVATGGGWPVRVGSMEELPAGTLSVWLDVGPARAVERVAGSAVERPLLDVDAPESTARRLLEQRRERYGLADARVDTDRLTVDDVTARILEVLEQRTGKPTRNER